MTRAKLGLVIALAVALFVGALSAGCWRAAHPEAPRMLRMPLPVATAASTVTEPAGRKSARVKRTPIDVDPSYVCSAVPLRPPSREHPRGTLVLGAWKELFEIDIETGSLVRRVGNPADGNSFQLVSIHSGMALAWQTQTSEVAFLDYDLRVQAVRSLGEGRGAIGMSTDGDDLVIASALRGRSEDTYEVVRMDASDARRVASVRQRGRVNWMDDYPAQVVVQKNRIHLLVYRPRIEVRTFDMDLVLTATTSVEPPGDFDVYIHDIFLKGSLTAAGNDLLVDAPGGYFIVAPNMRTARLLPPFPAPARFEDTEAVDAAGRVLLDSGYLAQRIGGPFERVVDGIGEKAWTPDAWGEQRYLDTPVTAFFWGGRGIIVTQYPEVALHVIDPERP